MPQINGETVINRPCVEVFDFVADERNRYDPRVRHTELVSKGPIGAGTRFRSQSISMGRPVEMVVEITGYDRPRRLASSTHLSLMDIHSSLTFTPVPEGTRLQWSSDLQPRGIFKAMAPLIVCTAQRQAQAIWAALKRTLEDEHTRKAPDT